MLRRDAAIRNVPSRQLLAADFVRANSPCFAPEASLAGHRRLVLTTLGLPCDLPVLSSITDRQPAFSTESFPIAS